MLDSAVAPFIIFVTTILIQLLHLPQHISNPERYGIPNKSFYKISIRYLCTTKKQQYAKRFL